MTETAQEFIAQVASLNGEKRYAAAGGGSMFNPGDIAEEILPGLRGGQLFAYLFRRFGYPSTGWDDYKELVRYCVTTPIEDVFLEIRPSMGSDAPSGHDATYDSTSLMFGYCVDQAIEDEFHLCLMKEGHAGWPEHPRYKELTAAFEIALRDLLRPVYVRDVPINCYGRVDDDEMENLLAEVESYHAAGYPIPKSFFKSTERWEQFTDALITLGEGSMDKGIDAVTNMVARAESK